MKYQMKITLSNVLLAIHSDSLVLRDY